MLASIQHFARDNNVKIANSVNLIVFLYICASQLCFMFSFLHEAQFPPQAQRLVNMAIIICECELERLFVFELFTLIN